MAAKTILFRASIFCERNDWRVGFAAKAAPTTACGVAEGQKKRPAEAGRFHGDAQGDQLTLIALQAAAVALYSAEPLP